MPLNILIIYNANNVACMNFGTMYETYYRHNHIMIHNFTLDWSISEDASEITPAKASIANPVKYIMR